ncbi:hypothetical protein [Psychromarinibacter sp. S121]|uniref:hypothetical protein n=1 Tax=Psychromarinibacter sp. S121 TaxID=3415127 RepID=UPI003C7992DC
MKTIIAAALALTAASPVLANDQLARSLGVEPGQYTLEELVVLKGAASEDGNEGRVYLNNLEDASRSTQNPVAIDAFRSAAEAD